MSWLSEAWNFDKYALKDLWGQIEDNPERLLIGAVGPYDTKMWNSILGTDYEPMLDQMGGPYGGHTVSAYGNTDGGVYQRAREDGVDTGYGEGAHDVAHTIAAIFGADALAGAAGGGGGASSGASGASTAGTDWGQYAKLAANAYGSMNQPDMAPQYGTPPTSYQPKKFRDTFKEGQDKKRRQNIAASLLRRAG